MHARVFTFTGFAVIDRKFKIKNFLFTLNNKGTVLQDVQIAALKERDFFFGNLNDFKQF